MRFPVGGYLSWVLQWLVGLREFGHEVSFVEKCRWNNGCYDPSTDSMTDDATYGTTVLAKTLEQFGFSRNWCFVDAAGEYHGLSKRCMDRVFRDADVFIDLGLAHGDWQEEAAAAKCRALVDGDPAFTQILWQQCLEENAPVPQYDFYFTVGQNVGTDASKVPTAGVQWRPLFHPIDVDLFEVTGSDSRAPFTTIMSWLGHNRIKYRGEVYGQKDVEFAKFVHLPKLTQAPFEVAVAGHRIPEEELLAAGWRVRNAVQTTLSFDAFRDYIAQSRAEFSVCKNAYVATNSGWFSDRAAAYLASGRPVVIQDTGFSAHLPCGRGLFAVTTAEQAAAAIDEIQSDWDGHSRAARELAGEYLDTSKVIAKFAAAVGI